MQRLYLCTTRYTTKESLDSPEAVWEAKIETFGYTADRAKERINKVRVSDLIEANPSLTNPALVNWSGNIDMTPENDTVTL